jgi:nicotinate-nucleotide--dimethylbenzimidazole phosphoribosyltransferase
LPVPARGYFVGGIYMELLKKTLENIKKRDEDAVKKAWKRLDNLAKPIGSLGYLEEIAAKMAGITGKVHNEIKKKNIIMMCADNGVVEEGVSSCPQNITTIMTNNFNKMITGVGVLAKHANSDITVIDIGVNGDFNNPKIVNKKIAYGTKNMAKGPAMSREEAIKAIEVGIETVDRLVNEGYDLFGTGEMGIGNTTTSAAVLSALSGLSPEVTAGKGAGLTDEQFEKKKRVIQKSLEVNSPDKNDVIDVISKVGGFDIAGMCGCFLGAAKNRVPIVIDGFISSAAALCACKLHSDVKDYIFESHLSAEPGAKYMMKELGLKPMLNLNMRLGEGSGCPLAFNIIEAALYMMNNMGTFEDLMIENNFLIDIR